MALPLEDILEGKYEILDKIAEGGMGALYKVRHKLLEEVRVIKVLRAQMADREDLRHRLMQEAKTAIRLQHPNIARLYDLAVANDGTAYVVMEFIDGVGLDSLLAASGPPSLDLSVEIGQQALKALDYLHETGFIHRDISPDNLMLTRDFQGAPRVKLIDLGIAKDLAEKSGVTAAGTFLGKVKYSPPELFKDADGARMLDQRSDNYSLGVTLYELVTGKYPFQGESFEELAAGHLFHPPCEFDKSDPDGLVPEALREVIQRALEKDPERRPASAGEFSGLLSRFATGETDLIAELEDRLEKTTRFLAESRDYRSAGSTQDHINEQFGLKTTDMTRATPASGGSGEEPAPGPVAVSPSPSAPARPSLWKKAAMVSLAAIPLAALATWWTLRAPANEEGASDLGGLLVEQAERFDPEDTVDIVEAPLVPILDPQSPEPATDSGPVDTPASEATEPPASQDEEADPAPAQPAVLLTAGPDVVEPKLLELLEPPYPKPDRNPIIVTVSALVGADGRVLTATVKSGPSFKRRFREAAVAVVEQAAFEPASREGVPGKMWTDVEVTFNP